MGAEWIAYEITSKKATKKEERCGHSTDLAPKILLYLKKCSKNELVVDLPCYINNNAIQKHIPLLVNFLADIKNSPGPSISLNNVNIEESAEIIQLFAILNMNSNAEEDANLPIEDRFYSDLENTALNYDKNRFIELLAIYHQNIIGDI